MNSLKKGEGVLLLNFEGGPGVPLLNFDGGPGCRVQGSQGSVSRGHGPTFTPCQLNISGKISAEPNFMRDNFSTLLYLNKLIRNMA